MATLSLKNISKIYPGNVRAVSDVNTDIANGEFVILVGPSGCGKSTLLRMIAGLEEISDGELSIDNRVVNHVHAKDRDIAFVFQNYALYPHMSVAENMAFGLKMRKFAAAEIDRRVTEAASILGLSEYLQRKPGALPNATALARARASGSFTSTHQRFWDAARRRLGDREGTRALIDVLLLHRQLSAAAVDAGISAVLAVGSVDVEV